MSQDHYASARHYKRWGDDKNKVCVLREDRITPFNPPIDYWNDNDRKTYFRAAGVKSNYSLTPENEREITKMEKAGHNLINSILQQATIPNNIDIDSIYRLIALFISNNPTLRESMKSALEYNMNQLMEAIQAEFQSPIAPPDMLIKSVNQLASASLDITNNHLYPYIKENFRFELLWSHPQRSFITSEIPVILVPSINNQYLFGFGCKVSKFEFYYENGAISILEINSDNEGKMNLTFSDQKTSDEPVRSKAFADYYSSFNIGLIYFPISPQFALYGINMNPEYNGIINPFPSVPAMLHRDQVLELNSWVFSFISGNSKIKAISSNYRILEQSVNYHNSKTTAGPQWKNEGPITMQQPN